MNIPARKKRERLGIRDDDGPIRSPSHLKWVRGHECVLKAKKFDVHGYPMNCDGKTEAAHIRNGTDGGVGLKPGDNFVVPLCESHHAAQHRMGEITFWCRVGLKPLEIADALWRTSPHGAKKVKP